MLSGRQPLNYFSRITFSLSLSLSLSRALMLSLSVLLSLSFSQSVSLSLYQAPIGGASGPASVGSKKETPGYEPSTLHAPIQWAILGVYNSENRG